MSNDRRGDGRSGQPRQQGGGQTWTPRQQDNGWGRQTGGGSQDRPPAVHVDRGEIEALLGTYTDATALAAAGRQLAERCHLLTPLAQVQIPRGHAVQVTAVWVTDLEADTFPINGSKRGEVGLGKRILDQLASGAGIKADPSRIVRLDDGSQPNYYHYQVTVLKPAFDGTEEPWTRSKELDLRDGSAKVAELKVQARGDVAFRIALSGQRIHGLSLAETGAFNRAVRAALGIRQKYVPAELERPFVAARLVFTGVYDNAETQAAVDLLMASARMGVTQQLYGGRVAVPKALERAGDGERPQVTTPPPIERHAPPPVGVGYDTGEDDDDGDGQVLDLPPDDGDANGSQGTLFDPERAFEVPTPEKFAQLGAGAQADLLVAMAAALGVPNQVQRDRALVNSPAWRLDSFQRMAKLLGGGDAG